MHLDEGETSGTPDGCTTSVQTDRGPQCVYALRSRHLRTLLRVQTTTDREVVWYDDDLLDHEVYVLVWWSWCRR